VLCSNKIVFWCIQGLFINNMAPDTIINKILNDKIITYGRPDQGHEP